MALPRGSMVKILPVSTGDAGSIPGSGRSPREGNGNPLQYSCLGNPMDRGAWLDTVQRVAGSQTQLSTHIHQHTMDPRNCVYMANGEASPVTRFD